MPEHNHNEMSAEDFQLSVVRYLDNDLSVDELVAFEQQLLEDPAKRRYLIESCCIVGAIADSENTIIDRHSLHASELPFEQENEAGNKRSPILGFLGDYSPPLSGGFTSYVPLLMVAIGLSAFLFGLGYLGHQKLGQSPVEYTIAKDSENRSAAPSTGPLHPVPTHTGPVQSLLADETPTGGPESVARLIETVECRWLDGGPEVGDPLDPGKRLRLESGCIKIAFGKRAELILEGPADFSVTSATGGELRYGQLSAEVFDAGKGFSIDAPGMRVLDLGTAFGFHVDPDGQGQVHVFKGEVEVALTKEGKQDSRRSQLLTEYRAVALDARDGNIDSLKLDPSRFIRTFDRSDLDITREYVAEVKGCRPVAYWRFEYLANGYVLNEMNDHYSGSSPVMRLVLSEDVQNKTLAVDQRSLTKPYMSVQEPIKELAGSNFTIECWVKPDGYQWITPVMLYFPNEAAEAAKKIATTGKRTAENTTPVAALVELLPGIGNETEPRVKLARALHRIPPTGVYHDGVDSFSNKEYEPDRWHHLVMVNDTDEMRLYMNGELVSQVPIADKITEAPLVSIGRFDEFIYPHRRAQNKEMAGQIDEVALYDKCLDEKTIIRHYRLGMRIDNMPTD